jgi:predicted transcriptional regulator
MKTRVTITLDPEVHRRAKKAAEKRHTTVSGLIEALLQSVSAPKKKSAVAEMTGIASLREPAPGTDPRYDGLKAKYLR